MSNKSEAIHLANRRCSACQKCALADTRTHLVYGDGNPDAKIMFIGEGPGEQEDLTGIPFVGPAGQLLDAMLDMIGLDRSDYYICNIVKCRPPRNRDPLNTEQDACIPWLYEQIDTIQPMLIVCLGRIAACRLIRSDYRITRDHGRWEEYKGTPITAIYDPSALLRDVTKRPETFDDLKSIQRKLVSLCPSFYDEKSYKPV